jgi:hypothetical protein
MYRSNYIFVDFESVQEIDLDLINGKPVKVFLFLGVQQHKVPVELMKQVHRFHAQVELVELESAGKNALDFVLAHHTGRVAVADPQGYFHILSRDKGFEALITHLRSHKILAARAEVFAKIPALFDPLKLPLPERIAKVRATLLKTPKTRPTKAQKMRSLIHSCFQKKLSDADVDSVLNGLVKEKAIAIAANSAVSYAF